MTSKHLPRVVLLTFLLVFVAARVTVFLIIARKHPDLYLHLDGTHVHHPTARMGSSHASSSWTKWHRARAEAAR